MAIFPEGTTGDRAGSRSREVRRLPESPSVPCPSVPRRRDRADRDGVREQDRDAQSGGGDVRGPDRRRVSSSEFRAGHRRRTEPSRRPGTDGPDHGVVASGVAGLHRRRGARDPAGGSGDRVPRPLAPLDVRRPRDRRSPDRRSRRRHEAIGDRRLPGIRDAVAPHRDQRRAACAPTGSRSHG